MQFVTVFIVARSVVLTRTVLSIRILQSVASGPVLHATLPNVDGEIPIMIVLRALGLISDRQNLEFIVYDMKDTQMMELLRPSLEESLLITTQQLALDYIGV